jgi:hypothetical protein
MLMKKRINSIHIVISARMGADFPMIPGFAPKVRSEI